jgi:hypothetical protein
LAFHFLGRGVFGRLRRFLAGDDGVSLAAAIYLKSRDFSAPQRPAVACVDRMTCSGDDRNRARRRTFGRRIISYGFQVDPARLRMFIRRENTLFQPNDRAVSSYNAH